MTTQEFKRLPLLLNLEEVMLVTGFNRRTVLKAFESRRTPGGHRRYRKRDVAVVVGMVEWL